MREPDAPFEIREVPIPEPGPGELVVAVLQANICGSDLHLFHGEMAPGFPRDVVLGHEMVGAVASIGDGAATDSAGVPLAVGDRVVYRYYTPCGHCMSCARGLEHHCPSSLVSVLRPASAPPHLVGGFAEHYLVGARQTRFKVPDDLDTAVVAGLNCALAQVVHGLDLAAPGPDETVVVQGCGGLGLYAIAVAASRGVQRIVAVDRHAARLALAERFGAHAVVDASATREAKARAAEVLRLTDGWGGDVVVEVVGRAAVIPEGIRMLARGGRYLELGSIVPRDRAEIDASVLVGGNRTIIGASLYPARALAESIAFLQRTSAPLGELVGATYTLEELDEAFASADALAREGIRVGRVGVVPHRAEGQEG